MKAKNYPYTSRDLVFDRETHTSVLPNGKRVAHVTAILGAVRVTTDFDELSEKNRKIAANVDAARIRGSEIHDCTHAYDDDDLAIELVSENIRPSVDAWVLFRQNSGVVPVSRERQVYHPVYDYTGIIDGVFMTREMRRVLIDIKNGNPDDAAAHLQTAAYEAAWNFEHPTQKIEERWSVWLRPELKTRDPYSVINYTARPGAGMDALKFFSCVTVYNEQPERRKVVR